jgi:hypothetical protein
MSQNGCSGQSASWYLISSCASANSAAWEVGELLGWRPDKYGVRKVSACRQQSVKKARSQARDRRVVIKVAVKRQLVLESLMHLVAYAWSKWPAHRCCCYSIMHACSGTFNVKVRYIRRRINVNAYCPSIVANCVLRGCATCRARPRCHVTPPSRFLRPLKTFSRRAKRIRRGHDSNMRPQRGIAR